MAITANKGLTAPTDPYIKSDPSLASSTRAYNLSAATINAVSAVSATYALPALNKTRELMLDVDTTSTIKFGNAAITTDTTSAGAIRLIADYPFHIRVPDDATHLAIISFGESGYLRATPVK